MLINISSLTTYRFPPGRLMDLDEASFHHTFACADDRIIEDIRLPGVPSASQTETERRAMRVL